MVGKISLQRHGLDHVEDFLDLGLGVHHDHLAVVGGQRLAGLEDRAHAGRADVLQLRQVQHQRADARGQQRRQAGGRVRRRCGCPAGRRARGAGCRWRQRRMRSNGQAHAFGSRWVICSDLRAARCGGRRDCRRLLRASSRTRWTPRPPIGRSPMSASRSGAGWLSGSKAARRRGTPGTLDGCPPTPAAPAPGRAGRRLAVAQYVADHFLQHHVRVVDAWPAARARPAQRPPRPSAGHRVGRRGARWYARVTVEALVPRRRGVQAQREHGDVVRLRRARAKRCAASSRPSQASAAPAAGRRASRRRCCRTRHRRGRRPRSRHRSRRTACPPVAAGHATPRNCRRRSRARARAPAGWTRRGPPRAAAPALVARAGHGDSAPVRRSSTPHSTVANMQVSLPATRWRPPSRSTRSGERPLPPPPPARSPCAS